MAEEPHCKCLMTSKSCCVSNLTLARHACSSDSDCRKIVSILGATFSITRSGFFNDHYGSRCFQIYCPHFPLCSIQVALIRQKTASNPDLSSLTVCTIDRYQVNKQTSIMLKVFPVSYRFALNLRESEGLLIRPTSMVKQTRQKGKLILSTSSAVLLAWSRRR
jgi:hypothetical protein